MTGRELGFLLLCSHLGQPERKPLTVSQMRALEEKARRHPGLAGEDLTEDHLRAMGCRAPLIRQILTLLSEEALAEDYVRRGKRAGLVPITKTDPRFPEALRNRLKGECPGVLWVKGDTELLRKAAVSLVGSREPATPNAGFAEAVGREAARQGYVLVSGNARGSDSIAMSACLHHGGSTVGVIADSLREKQVGKDMVLVSLYDYDAPFSSARALERNHSIHAWGYMTFVAQSGVYRGGTWSGTNHNLKHKLSPVCCFADGSEAQGVYASMGAVCAGLEALADLPKLWTPFYKPEGSL